MAVNPILAGANGIQSALKGMNNVAQEIAELNVDSENGTGSAPQDSGLDNMSDSLIRLKIYSRHVQSNVEVLKAADEMLGFLLDEFV